MEDKDIKEIAKFVAMVVRNTMEDFHIKHLKDKQMKELNPLVRNGIYTALYLLFKNKDGKYDKLVNWTTLMIPDYWEEPELTKDSKEAIKMLEEKK